MKKLILSSFLCFSLFCTTNGGATSLEIMIPEFSGPPHFSGFPQPALTIGNFSYVLPQGEKVVSATISGTFGNSEFQSSAGVDLFLDDLLVGQCKLATPCWFNFNGLIPWSHTFSSSEFSLLEDESATLTAIQTSFKNIGLGETTLVIETEPVVIPPPSPPGNMLPTPEPSTWLLLGTGIGLLSLSRKKK
jgi:hypothetical protein